jgi:hypothetical protein
MSSSRPIRKAACVLLPALSACGPGAAAAGPEDVDPRANMVENGLYTEFAVEGRDGFMTAYNI